jgi:hypothetical protein
MVRGPDFGKTIPSKNKFATLDLTKPNPMQTHNRAFIIINYNLKLWGCIIRTFKYTSWIFTTQGQEVEFHEIKLFFQFSWDQNS